jgi:hypothetical protein
MSHKNEEIKVGQFIKNKNSDDTYRVTSVGTLIEFEGDYGNGHVRVENFHNEFDIVQGSSILKVTADGVDCPYCDTWIEGFISDPRGTTITCESCNNSFVIDPVSVQF